MHGASLSDFLEKLTSDGFAASSRAHARVTKSLWSPREKAMAREAIAEHYADEGKVKPPPSLPTSTWARGIVNAKPAPKKPPPPAKPAPKAPAKPTPKQAPPKKKTRSVMTPEERLEKHRAYNREYARRKKAEADAAIAATRRAASAPMSREETAANASALAELLNGPPPFMVEHKGESALATLRAMAFATQHELQNVEVRVAALEAMPAAKRAAVDPLESVRTLQCAMLAVADASKVDAELMPELHRIGRSVARLCVHIVETMAGPEQPPPKGRKKEEWQITPPPLPAEETVSLTFDDTDEGPTSMAAE